MQLLLFQHYYYYYYYTLLYIHSKYDFDVVLHVSKKDRLDVVRGEMMIDHQRDGQSIRATSGTWVRRQVCRFTREDSGSRISNLSIMFPYAGQRIINGRGGAILRESIRKDGNWDAPSAGSCMRL